MALQKSMVCDQTRGSRRGREKEREREGEGEGGRERGREGEGEGGGWGEEGRKEGTRLKHGIKCIHVDAYNYTNQCSMLSVPISAVVYTLGQ